MVAPPQVLSSTHAWQVPVLAPVVTHTPWRQSVLSVQTPSPDASPHSLSAPSQVPLAQMAEATSELQAPASAGE